MNWPLAFVAACAVSAAAVITFGYLRNRGRYVTPRLTVPDDLPKSSASLVCPWCADQGLTVTFRTFSAYADHITRPNHLTAQEN